MSSFNFFLMLMRDGVFSRVYWHKYHPRTEVISPANTTDTIPESLIIAPKEILAVFSKELPTYRPINEALWQSVPLAITLPSSSETDPDSIIFFAFFQTWAEITPERENWIPLTIRPIRYPATTLLPRPKPIAKGASKVWVINKILSELELGNIWTKMMLQLRRRQHNLAMYFLVKFLHLLSAGHSRYLQAMLMIFEQLARWCLILGREPSHRAKLQRRLVAMWLKWNLKS